jgi:hypothetical protein
MEHLEGGDDDEHVEITSDKAVGTGKPDNEVEPWLLHDQAQATWSYQDDDEGRSPESSRSSIAHAPKRSSWILSWTPPPT